MKIVVHGTNWIGDAVMSVPAIRTLRALFPKSHLTLYSRSWARGIFEDSDFIDEILSPPSKSFFTEVKIWRKHRFDLAVILTNSFRTALIAKLGGAKRRFGYANEGRGPLLTNSIAIPSWKSSKHEIYYYLNLVNEVEKGLLGTDTSNSVKLNGTVHVSDVRRESARRLLEGAGIDQSRQIIGLGVGSQNSNAKRWPAERFAALAHKLSSEQGANVVLLGSENETDTSNMVAKRGHGSVFDLTGKTSLREAVAVLAALDLFVSNDMGLAHISSAVGTKTLTIFGPTNPLTTQPWNSEIIRREDVDCSPCMLRDCPIDHRCMTRIEVDDVFQRASNMLSV